MTLLFQKFRDLSIVDLYSKEKLVIACDSSAGIGQKECDQIVIEPEVSASFCLRVPLMELFCFGAVPICVTDLIGNEYDPTGKRMLIGIKNELKKAGLDNLPLNGSTEDNMITKTSSIGVTVIGTIVGENILPRIDTNAVLLQLGEPFVGHEVKQNKNLIFSYHMVKNLKKEKGVLDMVPVGSKGIRYEAETMAKLNRMSINFSQYQDLEKSAGPATVILIAIEKKYEYKITNKYTMLKKIGEFHP